MQDCIHTYAHTTNVYFGSREFIDLFQLLGFTVFANLTFFPFNCLWLWNKIALQRDEWEVERDKIMFFFLWRIKTPILMSVIMQAEEFQNVKEWVLSDKQSLFKSVFTHSCWKYLLSTHYIPGTCNSKQNTSHQETRCTA